MQVYINRAKRTADGVNVYWQTEDSADPTMAAANAPSPSANYQDVVTVGMRSQRSFLKLADLSAQCDGSNQSYTVAESYAAGSLIVWFNGQQQRTGSGLEITEASATAFTTSFTAPSGSVIVAGYRPL